MPRARFAKHPKTESGAAPAASGDVQPSLSKAEAVRRALAEGLSSPVDIVEYAKAKHGIDIPRTQVSVYKANFKRKEQDKAGTGGMAKAVARKVSTGLRPMSDAGIIDDIIAVKQLVNRLGVEQVKKLADLFE